MSEGATTYERSIAFLLLILIKDDEVKNAKDIKALLAWRIQLWREGELQKLTNEAERGGMRLSKRRPPPTMKHRIGRAARLTQRGRMRAVARVMQEEAEITVLSTTETVKTRNGLRDILSLLKEKHPPPIPSQHLPTRFTAPHVR